MPTMGRIVQVVAQGFVFEELGEQQEKYPAIVTELQPHPKERQSTIKVSMFTGDIRQPVLVFWVCHKMEAEPNEPYWDWLYSGQATNTINQKP